MFGDCNSDQDRTERRTPEPARLPGVWGAVSAHAEKTSQAVAERVSRTEAMGERWLDLRDALAATAVDRMHRFQAKFPRAAQLGLRLRRIVQGYAVRAARAYTSMSWARVAVLTVLLLSLLFAVDSMTGHLSAFTIIYMLPIWLAARLAGGAAGCFAMVLVGTLMSLTDAGGVPMTQDEAVLTFAIRWIGLGGFLISILHIENALKTARQQASHDPLTGLVNRTSIEAAANAAIARCGGDGRIHVGVLDCDDFKALNDTNGHAFGDHALRVLARRLESVVKDKGQIGRMGGDEFVVLFQNISAKDARHLLEKAHSGYRRILASLGCSAGISYGLATCGKDGDSFERLTRVADERMYARKRAATAKAVVAVEASAAANVSVA